jgi:hypothetical protein
MWSWLVNELVLFVMYGIVFAVFLFFFDVKITRRR